MKKIDEKIYKNKGNVFLINTLLKYFDGATDLRCLDIGCGAGDNAKILKEKGFIIDGITGSIEEKEYVSDIIEDVTICNLENGIPEKLLERRYDLLLMSHVLEHIAFPDKLLKDLKRLSNRTTKVVIGIPNIMHYQYRKKILLGNFDYEESDIMDYTHLRWYTLKSLKKTMENFGFEVIYLGVEVHLPRVFSFMPRLIQGQIRNLMIRVSPGLFGNQIVLVAKTSAL